MSENETTQPSKFRTKNWVKINDQSHGTYNTNSQIKFKTTLLKSSLCDYSNAYIRARGIVKVIGKGATTAAIANDGNNKQIMFKNCAPFTDCISEINNIQWDNAKDLDDVVIPMHNLIKYSDHYATLA